MNKQQLKEFNIFLSSLNKLAEFKQSSDYIPYFVAYELKGSLKDLSALFSKQFNENLIVKTSPTKMQVIEDYLLSFFNFLEQFDLSKNTFNISDFKNSTRFKLDEFLNFNLEWLIVNGVDCDVSMSVVGKVFVAQNNMDDSVIVIDFGYSD
jgi:hypothetical protein